MIRDSYIEASNGEGLTQLDDEEFNLLNTKAQVLMQLLEKKDDIPEDLKDSYAELVGHVSAEWSKDNAEDIDGISEMGI